VERRLKLLGHPIHPMLVVLPLGLLPAAVLFDVAYFVTDDPVFARIAFWDIALGIMGGLAAALFGLVDWLGLAWGTRAKQVGLIHATGNVIVLALFATSLWLRLPATDAAPDPLAFVLGLLAVALALGTAWLGGELVYRLGVGVDEEAHADASSSLRTGMVGQFRRRSRRVTREPAVRRR
jgi:uncharacterized membrane protein